MASKNETLALAIKTREDEVQHYQINIDNYAAAIAKIEVQYSGNDTISQAMQEFKKQLQDLHASSVIEQAKAQLMLDVIKEQLED